MHPPSFSPERRAARGGRTCRALTSTFLLTLAPACGLRSVEDAGALVPPAADQDPALPQMSLAVAGHAPALHVRTFGDPSNPVLLVLHGGPGADFRLLLPLGALSDRYFVVMWDQRGAGLSERVPGSELTLDAADEEIGAVQAAVAPGRRVSLIGHSFGGDLAVRYAARHPDSVDQVVLVEPGPFDAHGRANYHGGQGSGSLLDPDLHEILWENEILSPSDHAAMDYRLLAALRPSTSDFYCPGEAPREYVIWRFGAFALHVLSDRVREAGDAFDWSRGIERLPATVLVVAGTCGAAGAAFQKTYNTPLLPAYRLVEIPGAGHITLFYEHATETLAAIRSELAAYR